MKLKKRNRNLVVLMILTLGMLSYYSALPFLPTQVLPTKVSAYNLSPVPEREGMVYALTESGKLINFNFFTPSSINNTVNVTGLADGELVLGIDYRPRTGQLFAVTNQSRVYTINTLNGMSTQVGVVPITPGTTGFAYGVDFNPVPDLIRVVNENDQNLRVNPNTGTVVGVDGTLAFSTTDPNEPNAGANPNIVAAAYTNSFSGATATTLYGIDSDLNVLVRQGGLNGAAPSPNDGILFTVGSLGVDTNEQVGFDIAAPGDMALASLTSPGATTSSLYWIDLPTGTATLISQIGGGEPIRDLAIVTRVETIFALTPSNRLISFNSGTPGTPLSTLPIRGLPGNEILVALDFRPATGELYSSGTSGRLYTINTSTGLATPVNISTVPLNNPNIGFDFNPTVDLLRVVNGANQNLRVNANNSALAGTDGNLAFAASDGNAAADPNVVASAYTNNSADATATTLYGIDSDLDVLVMQGNASLTPPVSPNTGQLFTIGALTMGMTPLDTDPNVGFDVAPDTNAAFVSLTLPGMTSSTLGTINLSSGAVTPIGMIAGGEVISDIAIGVRFERVFAVTANNVLVSFNSRNPAAIMRTVAISGLQAGETLVGIDFRTATGQLYGLSSSSSIYQIDVTSGNAVRVGTPLSPALIGTSFGFDFNPTVDRIRVTSDQGQNLRLNPINGALAGTDGNLVYGPGDNFAGQPTVGVAAAYTNSFVTTPPTPTTLFLIDPSKNILARQGSAGGTPISPNTGQVSTIGPLGVVTTNQVGFDVSDDNNAYASLTAPGATQSRFYRINLRTGAATAVGRNVMNTIMNTIGVSGVVNDIAVQTNFTPSAVDGFVVANSASFIVGPVAPDSLASLFGAFQTTGGGAFVPPSTVGPTLGGLSVTFNGTSPANIYYSGPAQMNIVVPSGVSDGPNFVQVTNANGATRAGIVIVARAAPGIFTANGTGTGTAFGFTTFDGVTYNSLINPDGTERAVPIANASGRPNIIVVLATGVRNAMAANPSDSNGVAEAVTATVNGIPVPVAFAGGVGNGDQVNFTIPVATLAQINPMGSPTLQVTLQFTIGGQMSNMVTFTIAPPLGSTTPATALQRAGVVQTINGSDPATSRLQFTPDDIKSMPGSLRETFLYEESADRSKSERLR
jgi:trimeric autotransporter adhesin